MDKFNDPQPCVPGGSGEFPGIDSNMAPIAKVDSVWELHKDEIYTVYIKEDRTLPSTISVFEQKYGLNASVRKWKMILDSWKFNKNVKAEDMLFVVAKAAKRTDDEGKETVFYYEGVQIKEEKIKRFKRRKIAKSQQIVALNPGTPPSIRYNTPSPRDGPAVQDTNTRDEIQSMHHTRILPDSSQEPGSQDGTEIPEMIACHEFCEAQMMDIMSTDTAAVKIQRETFNGVEKRSVRTVTNINDLKECCEPSNSLCFLPYLPHSIMENLVTMLNFDDVFELSLVCKRLGYLITDEIICRKVLQNKLAHSKEALEAFKSETSYATALRRAAKRREALRTAAPFTCATLGFADNYIYCCGILCYSFDDRMRILDLHNSSKHETVVSIPRLLRYAIPEPHDLAKGNFQILYSNKEIFCCLFKTIHPHPRAWLIVFNINGRTVLAAEPVEPNPKVFARHNHNVIYFGTNSGRPIDGYERWSIRCYDFHRKKWFDETSHISDALNSEIGTTICFEMHGDRLFVVVSQVSCEEVGATYVSFYLWFRFSPTENKLKVESGSGWRRNHGEGPIDDRWNALQLELDEQRGFLRIHEGRKEWHEGSSNSEMRYYTTDIIFPMAFSLEIQAEERVLDIMRRERLQDIGLSSDTSQPSSEQLHPIDSTKGLAVGLIGVGPRLSPLLRLLRSDYPGHIHPPLRMPDQVRPVRHGILPRTFTLAKTKIRSYNASTSTVLYLVDDPLPTNWRGTQRLRLRVDSRSCGPLRKDRCGNWDRYLRVDLSMAFKWMYISSPVTFWPSAQNPDTNLRDESVDKIYELLNPPAFLGDVHGTADERSLIYLTGLREGEPQAIVFLSFDPAIKLEGLVKLQGSKRLDSYVDIGESERTVSLDKVGCQTARSGTGCSAITSSRTNVIDIEYKSKQSKQSVRGSCHEASLDCWIWTEKPMYRDINRGYDLSFNK